MKKMCLTAVAFALVALWFSGCASTNGIAAPTKADFQETTSAKPFSTIIKAISKEGNCSLELTPKLMAEAGYAPGDILSVTVGKMTLNLPYGTSYSDVDYGEPLIVNFEGDIQLAINMENFSATYKVVEGNAISVRMSKKAGYLKEYKIHHLNKSNNRKDYASDAIFANFRSVKAGKIAKNRLFRGCNPVGTDERAPYSDALAKEADIQVVMNLCDTAESAATQFYHSPYYASCSEKGNIIYLNMDISFNTPEFVTKLHDGLVFLSEHPTGPYMVHCMEGKDRAGFVNALLEALCGATLEEITEDYMLSFENYYGIQKGSEQYALFSQAISDMFKTMNAGKSVTNKNVKAVTEKYVLDTVALTKAQLDALVTVLTK